MKTTRYILLLTAMCFYNLAPAQPRLDNYIREGLSSNESIRQQNFLLDVNLHSLREARALFYPNLNVQSNYFKAGGGRSVELPLGDLLNPVYSTLNQLTGNSHFPTLKNESIPLNPDNFYDIHVKAGVPLVNRELRYQRGIASSRVRLQQIEIDFFKRELVREIKSAYYRLAQATEAIKIYENALLIVKESQRINRTLFDNEKINRTAVTRSDNEVNKVDSQLFAARQQRQTALAHFNFLCNQPPATPVVLDTFNYSEGPYLLIDTSLAKREELKKMATVTEIADLSVALMRSYRIPKISAFLDLGVQESDFKWNPNSPYYFLGLSLEWPLFTAGRNSSKVKKAESERDAVHSQTRYLQSQLQLQLTTALNAYHSALSVYRAAQTSLVSSEKYYSDVLKQYKQGMVLFLELLDAQNEYIRAQLERNLAFYEVQIKIAEVERANASYNLNN